MRKIITRVPRFIVHIGLWLYRVLAFLLEIIDWPLYLLNKISFKAFSIIGVILFSFQVGHRMHVGLDVKWLFVSVSFLIYLIAVVLFKYVVAPLFHWISERVTIDVNTLFPPYGLGYMIFKPDEIYTLFDEEELEHRRRYPDVYTHKRHNHY